LKLSLSKTVQQENQGRTKPEREQTALVMLLFNAAYVKRSEASEADKVKPAAFVVLVFNTAFDRFGCVLLSRQSG